MGDNIIQHLFGKNDEKDRIIKSLKEIIIHLNEVVKMLERE